MVGVSVAVGDCVGARVVGKTVTECVGSDDGSRLVGEPLGSIGVGVGVVVFVIVVVGNTDTIGAGA